jgi:oligoribonuclease NrnB/cAMP/cGMP phosphodiesterase (DHH superfamily)
MKTACVYHSRDLDGWMSAAIVKHWFNQQEVPNKQGEDCNTIEFMGYDYGQPIPELSSYNKIIMVDVSFPYETMADLYDMLGEHFIWIDHHNSALKMMFTDNERSLHPLGRQNVSYAACELSWQYFFHNEPIPEIVRLLGRYDCFGHKGTNEELKVLQFQYGARQCITNYESAYDHLINCTKTKESEYWRLYAQELVGRILENGKSIYQYLCTEAKQIYKRAFAVEFIEPFISNDIPGISGSSFKHRHFLCVNQDRFNPINFGIDYHKDDYDGFACFWFANGKWNFSLYNDNGEVDCSAIAKQFGGGGHKGAAGFITNDLKSVLGI